MSFLSSSAVAATRPGLCTTYDAHDPALLAGVLPYIDFLEVTPDTIARRREGRTELHPAIVADLQSVAGQVKILAHGVGLSIGSYDSMSDDYLQLLDELAAAVPLYWHSEHLGYTTVGGENLNTMLAVPRTREMLDLLIRRIRILQERYDLPFLIENIVHLLPDYPPDFSDADFLNRLSGETGCGLILDLYNLECDAQNYGFDVDTFLQELDLTAVREIHLAGGTEYHGFRLDIHSQRLADSTIALTQQVLSMDLPQLEVITYEILPQAVKINGPQLVVEELDRLAGLLQEAFV